MSSAGTQREDAWEGTGLWTTLYAGSLVVLTAVVALTDTAPERKAAGAALSALGIAAYALWGRTGMRPGPHAENPLYLALALAITGVLFTVHPLYFFTMFGAFPLCFSMVEGVKRYAASSALGLAASIGIAGWEGWGWDGWRTGLVEGGISAVFAVVMGNWISRIIDQSRQRQELLAALEATRQALADAHREAGTLAERQRLAGEIHDTLAQGFTSILMLVRGAAGAIGSDPDKVRRLLAAAEDTAQENLDEARSLVAALQPVALQRSSLDDALVRLAERFTAETAIAVACTVTGTPQVLSPAEDVVLLRAAQEALANVRKHASARTVRLELAHGADGVRLVVTDDGAGFDPAISHGGGFGLDAMRARAAQVGATVCVTSAPQHGTAVEVVLP